MKNILVIFGGPRRSKNTGILINRFLDSIDKDLARAETILLSELNISPCTSCYGCSKTGECIINDDMAELYGKIKSCDIIVLASPIYFGNVSAFTKAMIDRCQAFWSAKYLAGKRKNVDKKKGYFFATAGSIEYASFDCAKHTVKLFFAACDADYDKDILVDNTDSVPVDMNQEAIDKAVSLAADL